MIRGLGGAIPFVAGGTDSKTDLALSYLPNSIIQFHLTGCLRVTRYSVLDWADILSERGRGTFSFGMAVWSAWPKSWRNRNHQTFAETAASLTVGWKWGAALAVLLLIFTHYGFASITAHSTAIHAVPRRDSGGRCAAISGRVGARLSI